ncbi:Putative deoxyribonuclease YcfH [Staphylococcus aureus]|uniref:Deoxyribonuclease YcfH n=1 Tax=Staphylococcus aureus TaxID=1280 RepID=A0A380DJW7_STAAU|nr:Putative deoxyribonuclease YcfH [Staphylococcus aureus]
MLIDTHVHLNDKQYDDDLSEVITLLEKQVLIVCL